MNQDENLQSVNKGKNFNKKKILILSIVIILVVSVLIYTLSGDKTAIKKETGKPEKEVTEVIEVVDDQKLSINGIEDFDFSFLQLENANKNIVYSPISIKYALKMLEEGAAGNSKDQLSNLIGDYKPNKYVSSPNMSFANALFIRNSYKNNVNSNYVSILKSRYNTEIIYDSFANANNLNDWASKKTYGLINSLFDDISDNDFILANALAIDMEWKNVIQSTGGRGIFYNINYQHENFSADISNLYNDESYHSLEFNNENINVKAVEIGAAINNYDIFKELGEQNIRETVTNEYKKWLAAGVCPDGSAKEKDDKFIDKYMSELGSNYKRVDASTDFLLHSDDDVKVFAKDLETYNGTTLQYVGIMPKKVKLNKYVKDLKVTDINSIISNLKTIELNNFESGKVTEIKGYIPLFEFDYELKFIEDLNLLGVTDIFEMEKADLTEITSDKGAFINQATHKAVIEFSNDGIKAAAVTEAGGYGADDGCYFDYIYDVPVKTIDLTFDEPYLFLIRDKDTGEIWFVGSVYEPIKKD